MASSTAPRWLSAMTKAEKLPENYHQDVYQLATVDANGAPHARTVVHRDILHPAGYPQLPLVLTTTDVRTPKVVQMRGAPRAELTWWMGGSQDQFRVSGPVRVVPSPEDPMHADALRAATPALDMLRKQRFDWEAKRRAVFDGMSAHMKASWCRPPPGSVMDAYEDAKKWPQTVPKLGEAESEEDKRNQELALRNFALVLVEAEEVDWLQLAEKPNQRTRFTRKDDSEWLEEIIVP